MRRVCLLKRSVVVAVTAEALDPIRCIRWCRDRRNGCRWRHRWQRHRDVARTEREYRVDDQHLGRTFGGCVRCSRSVAAEATAAAPCKPRLAHSVLRPCGGREWWRGRQFRNRFDHERHGRAEPDPDRWRRFSRCLSSECRWRRGQWWICRSHRCFGRSGVGLGVGIGWWQRRYRR